MTHKIIFLLLIASISNAYAGFSIAPKDVCSSAGNVIDNKKPDELLNVSDFQKKYLPLEEFKKIQAFLTEMSQPRNRNERHAFCLKYLDDKGIILKFPSGTENKKKDAEFTVVAVDEKVSTQETLAILAKDGSMHEDGHDIETEDLNEAKKRQIKNACEGRINDDCDVTITFLHSEIIEAEKFSKKLATYQNDKMSLSGTPLKPAYGQLDPYGEISCGCLGQTLQENLLKKEDIMASAAKEINEVEKEIINAAGKKFINDFASLHEDITYYEHTIATKLLEGEKEIVDDKSLCKDFKSFKKSIDVACAQSGMNNKEQRISEFLGVYGNDFGKGENDFIKGFQGLVADIDAPYTSSNGSKNNLYTRKNFNEARSVMNDLNNGQKEVKAVNDLVTKLIRTKSLNDDILESLKMNANLTPLEAIEMILSDPAKNKEIMSLLSKLDNKMNNALITKWKATKSQEEFSKEMKTNFDIVLAMHPGLKQALQNRDLYTKANPKVSFDNSLIETIESDRMIADAFANRCKALEENLAEAICTKQEDVRSKVSQADLLKIIDSKDNHSDDKSNAMKLLACMNQNKDGASNSPYGNLTIDTSRPFSTSDFTKTKEYKAPTFFSNLANKTAEDSKFAKAMEKITAANADQRISNDTLKSAKAYRESSDYKPFNSDDFVSEVTKAPKTSTSTAEVDKSSKEVQPKAPVFQATQEAVLSPMTPDFKASAPIKEIPNPIALPSGPPESSLNPKDELKKYISGENPDVIKKHLENINMDDAKELANLRKKLNESQEELSAVKLAQESAKLNDLMLKNEELQKRLEAMSKPQSSEPSRSLASPQSDSNNFKAQYFNAPKDNANFIDNRSVSDRAGSVDQSAPQFAASGNIRADSSPNAAAAGGPTHDIESSPLNRIIITSSAPDGSRSLQDPSIELINYLNKKAPDIKTLNELQELKESGMIYTYDVKDNGKDLKVSKLIKYNDLSKEAKKLVDSKILVLSLSEEVKNQKRLSSYQALKLEILKLKYQ